MNSAAMARIADDFVRAEAKLDLPRYRQIIEALVGAIEHGTLNPGDRLPPETKMAKLFSVSLGTVQNALAHLADGGFLQRTHRRGTFVAGRQAEDVFVFRFRNPETGTVLIPFTRVLTTYQSVQIPAGHRPIELDAAPIATRIGRFADHVVGGSPSDSAAAMRD